MRTRKPLKMRDDLHGHVTGWVNRGCRCDDCREAWKEYNAARRAATKRVVNVHRAEYRRYLAEEQGQRNLRVAVLVPRADDPYALGYEAGRQAGIQESLRSLREHITAFLAKEAS